MTRSENKDCPCQGIPPTRPRVWNRVKGCFQADVNSRLFRINHLPKYFSRLILKPVEAFFRHGSHESFVNTLIC